MKCKQSKSDIQRHSVVPIATFPFKQRYLDLPWITTGLKVSISVMAMIVLIVTEKKRKENCHYYYYGYGHR